MATALDRRVDQFRRFNRFFTQRIGVLAENFLRTPFTLAEGRVLFELASREATSPGDIAAALDLDPGYLSRILRRFERQGFVQRMTSSIDGRRAVLTLTDTGRDAFAPLNERSHDDIAALLAPLPADRQGAVLNAMDLIAEALAPDTLAAADIVLREPELGDYGWVIERHGVLYGAEYGFNTHMEGCAAEIIAAYVANYQPKRDRCWIAERNGTRCGCVFVVHDDATTARLRLLLTEPSARGSGLGRRLVRACLTFAREAGYDKMVLWTHSNLTAARAIYASEGFVLIASEPNDLFGPHLTSETWELDL